MSQRWRVTIAARFSGLSHTPEPDEYVVTESTGPQALREAVSAWLKDGCSVAHDVITVTLVPDRSTPIP